MNMGYFAIIYWVALVKLLILNMINPALLTLRCPLRENFHNAMNVHYLILALSQSSYRRCLLIRLP